MSAFDLQENPFALLGTHPRANREQLEDAYQDAFLDAEDPASEARLNRAQQQVVSPKDRLDSELGFFVDTKPATITAVLAALGTSSAHSWVGQLVGLDHANLLAHLCSEGVTEERRSSVFALIDAYESIEANQVLEAINSSRAISGFAFTELGAVRAALSKLCSKHSSASIDALLLLENGPSLITDLARGLTDCAPSRRVILEGMLREYEARVGHELELGTERIRNLLVDVSKQPDAPEFINRVSDSLRDWQQKARPLQVADRVRGIDEHHSRHLFEVVRDTCLSLANDRQLFEQSLDISRVALEVFSELPEAARKISEDVKKLQDLLLEKKQIDRLAPLAGAVEKAQNNHSETCRALKKAGFSGDAASPIKEVYRAYIAVIKCDYGTDINGMAARLVRSLGIDLCNESSDNEGAMTLIEGLLDHRSSLPNDVIETLEIDRATLAKNIDFNAMLVALKAARWDEADRLAVQLLASADDENRQMLIGIRSTIAERKRGKLMKMIGWGILAIIALFVFLSNQPNNSGSSYSQYGSGYEANSTSGDQITLNDEQPYSPYEAPAAAPYAEESDAAAAATEASVMPGAPSAMEETPPASYQSYNTLNVSELRYCKRQNARITAAESYVSTNSQIDRYNSAVEDYNSRCGNYRYLQVDMNQVDREIANDAATLRSEGLAIIGDYE